MLHDINIVIHVVAGSIGLAIGTIPFFTKKGGHQHRVFGKIFLGAISISIITAFNGVLFFRDRPFLTVITLLSLYQSISGFRALRYKERGPGSFDLMLVMTMVTAEVLFILKINGSNVIWPKTIIYGTLGYMTLYLFYDTLRIFKIFRSKNLWLIEHIVKMTGAFSALFTAAMGTVLSFWQPYNQIISASASSLLLLFVLFKYFLKWRKELLPMVDLKSNHLSISKEEI
jgi:uncharacterized membrane protein